MQKNNQADSVVVRQSDGILAVRDALSLSQFQVLSIIADTVFLENGGFIKLPMDKIEDADSDSTNEIQTIVSMDPENLLLMGSDGGAKFSIETPADTAQSFEKDMMLANTLCGCETITPFVVESALNNGYSTIDLINSGVPFEPLLKGGGNVPDLLLSGNTVTQMLALISPIQLYQQGADLDSLYGEIYKGGYIFYVDIIDDLPGIEGMVAYTSDIGSVGKEWGCLGTDIPELPTTPFNFIEGHPGTRIGDGAINTTIIDTSSCSAAISAASLCAALDNNYDDWFLPSIAELKELNNNIGTKAPAPSTNIAGLAAGNVAYWASNECNANLAFYLSALHGSITHNGNKNSSFKIRPVRAF